MKKLLAIILTIAMMASTVVGLAFTSSAAKTSTGCLVNTGYGYVEYDNKFSGAYAISFDLWLVDDSSAIAFWADTASTRYTFAATYVGVEKAGGGSAYSANEFNTIEWGKTGLVGTMHHFKLILNNGYDAIEMDGTEVWRGSTTANAYWEGAMICNTASGGVGVDNFAITSVDEATVYYSNDFENGMDKFKDIGASTDVALPKVETVKTKGLMVNAGYIEWKNLPKELGSSYTVSYDLWLADADSGIQFWADTASTRLTVTGTYVGVEHAGGGSAYPANDYHEYSWGEKIGFATDGWHHVDMQFNVGGSDNILIDGVEVYHSGRTCGAYWTGNSILGNTLGNGVAIDNIQFGSNDAYTFEEGTVNPFNEIGNTCDLIVTQGDAETVTSNGLMVNSGYIEWKNLPKNLGDSYTVSYDLWLADADSAIQFWADTASSRLTVAGTYVGMDNAGGGSAYPADDFKSYEWGDLIGFASAGWHHVEMQFNVGGSDNILIDGVEVYHSGRTCGAYWTGNMILGNTLGGGVAIDNIQFGTNDVIDFEEGTYVPFDVGSSTTVVVEGEEFVCRNHVAGDAVREEEPTCHSFGKDAYYCAICGALMRTEDVPMLPHDWPNYKSYQTAKEATATEDGIRRWYCNGGCGTYVDSAMPATDKYEGKLYSYLDFENETVIKEVTDVLTSDYAKVENGVASILNGYDNPYNQYWPGVGGNMNDYAVSFDFKFNGTFDNNDTSSRGHTTYFWFGGQDGMSMRAGYDFDKGVFYIRAENGTNYVEEVPYELEAGKWYNLTFRVYAPGEDAYWDNDELSWCSIEINGETVIIFDTEDAVYDLPFPGSDDFTIIWTFGVMADIDNFAVGSHDFKWVSDGDISGDGKVTVRDLLLLKQIIAGTINPTVDYDSAKLDVNNDGKVTAADVTALRSKLMGN